MDNQNAKIFYHIGFGSSLESCENLNEARSSKIVYKDKRLVTLLRKLPTLLREYRLKHVSQCKTFSHYSDNVTVTDALPHEPKHTLFMVIANKNAANGPCGGLSLRNKRSKTTKLLIYEI